MKKKKEEKEKDFPYPCIAATPVGRMKEISTATNFVVSTPPAYASSPHSRPVADLLSRSVSIWSSTEKEEHVGGEGQGLGLSIWSRTEKEEQVGGQGQGLGLSILREGGEGTLTARILAAFVDCCFCA